MDESYISRSISLTEKKNRNIEFCFMCYKNQKLLQIGIGKPKETIDIL